MTRHPENWPDSGAMVPKSPSGRWRATLSRFSTMCSGLPCPRTPYGANHAGLLVGRAVSDRNRRGASDGVSSAICRGVRRTQARLSVPIQPDFPQADLGTLPPLLRVGRDTSKWIVFRVARDPVRIDLSSVSHPIGLLKRLEQYAHDGLHERVRIGAQRFRLDRIEPFVSDLFGNLDHPD